MRSPALLVLAASLLATPALAATWEPAGTTAKGNQVFVDQSKLKKATGDVRAVPYRIRYTQPLDLDGRTIASARYDARFDCRAGTVTTDKITLFTDGEGTRELAQKRDRVPLTIKEPAGTGGDVAWKVVCK